MMRLTVAGIFAVLIVGLWSGCAGKSPQQQQAEAAAKTTSKVPEWFLNPPTDPNFLYGTGTNDSRDLQMARDGAEHNARVQMARNIETKVNALFKSFMEQTGAAEDEELLRMNTNISKAIASQIIGGTRSKSQAIQDENGRFRVYVLLEMPLGEANTALRNQIRTQQNLYTRFRASQGFQDLDAEIEKYEQWKKEQGK